MATPRGSAISVIRTVFDGMVSANTAGLSCGGICGTAQAGGTAGVGPGERYLRPIAHLAIMSEIDSRRRG
jgi:hypothetical protein